MGAGITNFVIVWVICIEIILKYNNLLQLYNIYMDKLEEQIIVKGVDEDKVTSKTKAVKIIYNIGFKYSYNGIGQTYANPNKKCGHKFNAKYDKKYKTLVVKKTKIVGLYYV